MMAGCTSTPTTTAPTTTKGTATPTTTAAADLSGKLTLWDGTFSQNYAPKIIEAFNKVYPKVQVTVEYLPDAGMSDKYLTSMSSGAGPDVAACNNDWISTLAQAGTLVDLTSLIAADKVDMTDFFDGAQAATKYGSGIYAMPYRAETHGIFYNVDMFKEAGYDKMPETWEEVLPIIKAITAKGNGAYYGIGVPLGIVGNTTYQLFNMIRVAGGEILTEDRKSAAFNSAKAVKGTEFFVKLYLDGNTPKSAPENDNNMNRELFINKNIAMYMSGAYDIPTIKKGNPTLNFATAKVPYFQGEKRMTILAGWSMIVNKASKSQDAGWAFAKFVSGKNESVIYSPTFSARKSNVSNAAYADALYAPLVDAVNYGQPLQLIPELSQIKQIIFDNLELSWNASKPVADALNAAADEVNKLLNK
jgi:ABC-type glycerol-3-phosphate transport system substrate-binding protein